MSFIVAFVLLVVGLACWGMGHKAVTDVNKGLADQRIYFPPAGNPAFSSAVFPDAQKYAGKQVTTGKLAKAYADDVLAVQLKLVGNGKTTFEVGGMAAADPTNVALQQQQATMFQLDTSRSLMLLGGYGASSQAMMMESMGMVALAVAVVLLLVGGMQWMRYKRA
ncbi:MAG TPA: hypothetical protein VLF71_05000 [Candidatus Saccharimonadales bacterium]|nr:hypothetical protein [Candidatus Saccharimonadales bacterium]